MIPKHIQENANKLMSAGVDTIYVIIPQEPKSDMAAKEQRLFEYLRDLGFRHINSRRKITQFTYNGRTNNIVDSECFYYIIRSADAVLIVYEWFGDQDCRIEFLLAYRAQKHILNENMNKYQIITTIETEINTIF